MPVSWDLGSALKIAGNWDCWLVGWLVGVSHMGIKGASPLVNRD